MAWYGVGILDKRTLGTERNETVRAALLEDAVSVLPLHENTDYVIRDMFIGKSMLYAGVRFMKTNKRAGCVAILLALAMPFTACVIEADDGKIKIERAEIINSKEIAVIVSNDDKELSKEPRLLRDNAIVVISDRSSIYWFDQENIDLFWVEYDLFSGKTRKKHTGFLNRPLRAGDTVTIRGISKMSGSYTLHYY
jgi:hypothetical protein